MATKPEADPGLLATLGLFLPVCIVTWHGEDSERFVSGQPLGGQENHGMSGYLLPKPGPVRLAEQEPPLKTG